MPLPSYMDDPNWKKNKKKSAKQEARVASLAGGFVTPASGAGRFKGDVQNRDFKIECKTTVKDSIRLSASWLRKIESEAISDGKYPALALEIGDERYYVLTEFNFKDYLDYLKRDI